MQAVKIFACQPAEGDCLNSTALLAFTPDSKMGTQSRRKDLPHTFRPISYSLLLYVSGHIYFPYVLKLMLNCEIFCF